MIETVAQHCKHNDCKYRSTFDGEACCGYMLITGKSRNCDISRCNKYKAGERILRSTLGGLYYCDD